MPGHDRHRSRSPHTTSRRHRSRSPAHRPREGEARPSHSHRKHEHSSRDKPAPVRLPLDARELTKHDLPQFRAMFGLYLDLQKNKDIDELSSDEVKGRWKSFIGKWNRAELAEGWYDPATKTKADNSAIATERSARKEGIEIPEPEPRRTKQREQHEVQRQHQQPQHPNHEEEDEDEDDYGPSLPSAMQQGGRGLGPAVPGFSDIQHRNELSLEDEEARRSDLRYERKLDRRTQKERLEDLVPRAEPGSRERQLEKKQEAASTNRAFREARSPGAEEVGEKELLGDDEDGIKRKIKEMDKKKSERELRKEEVLRAREAEREERLRVHREKEDKTMETLRAIARERFGANC